MILSHGMFHVELGIGFVFDVEAFVSRGSRNWVRFDVEGLFHVELGIGFVLM